MTGIQFKVAVLALFLVRSPNAAHGGDIPGEVNPPPCEFNPDGSLRIGVPACTGPMQISLYSGSGVLSSDTARLGSVIEPWALTQSLSSKRAVLGFVGGFGIAPAPPVPNTPGNSTSSDHWFGRVFSLTLTNETSLAWTGLNLELQSTLDLPSDDDDGLSFGQIERNPQKLFLQPSSNVFSDVRFEANANASVTFAGSTLVPGNSVNVNFLITDNGPNSPFSLIEQPSFVPTPEPATFTACLVALLLAFAARLFCPKKYKIGS